MKTTLAFNFDFYKAFKQQKRRNISKKHCKLTASIFVHVNLNFEKRLIMAIEAL